MPLCPQITNTPITVVLNADFTVTDVVPVLPANTVQVNTAQTTASTALADALIAFNAAKASLQPSANTIVNATNQITAINGTGITVYSGASPTSGARVVLNSVGLAGFNSGGTATFSVSATTGAAVFSGAVTGATITGGTLNISGNAIIDAAGLLTATGANITGAITATSGSFTGSIFTTNGTIGGFTINASSIFAGTSLQIQSGGSIIGGNSSTLFYGFANIGGGTAGSERLIVTGNSSFVGNTIATGDVTAQNNYYYPFPNVSSGTANLRVQAGSTPAGRIVDNGASSQRYKHDIVNLRDVPELDPRKLYDLPVRAFKYNLDYLNANDDRYDVLMPGFIAEEVDQVYPLAADYEPTIGIQTWNDRMLIPAMMALIQDLHKEIQTLKGE